MARRLVTLKNDVDFDFDAERCRFAGLNPEALKQHFELLGFRNLIARLNLETPRPRPHKKSYVPFN